MFAPGAAVILVFFTYAGEDSVEVSTCLLGGYERVRVRASQQRVAASLGSRGLVGQGP